MHNAFNVFFFFFFFVQYSSGLDRVIKKNLWQTLAWADSFCWQPLQETRVLLLWLCLLLCFMFNCAVFTGLDILNVAPAPQLLGQVMRVCNGEFPSLCFFFPLPFEVTHHIGFQGWKIKIRVSSWMHSHKFKNRTCTFALAFVFFLRVHCAPFSRIIFTQCWNVLTATFIEL